MSIKVKTPTSFSVTGYYGMIQLESILDVLNFAEVSHTVQHVDRRWKMGTTYVNLFHTGSLTVQDDYKSVAYRQVIHSLREASHEA